MVEFTFKRMVGSLLCLAFLTSCGLRDQLRAQRDQEKTDDTTRNTETTHQIEDKYQDQLADLAHKDLNTYHAYLQGIAGEYRGSYRTVGVSAADAMSGGISIVIKIENDLVGTTPNSKITADQYRSMMNAMTLSVIVVEEFGSGEALIKTVCDQSGVKIEEASGRIHFICSGTGDSSGFDYNLVLNQNADLIAGTSSHIETIDASIAAPQGVSFTARLQMRATTPSTKSAGKAGSKAATKTKN